MESPAFQDPSAPPDVGARTRGVADAGRDAGLQPKDAGQPDIEADASKGPAPVLLAFIEAPIETRADLRLVDAAAALRSSQPPDEAPPWRRTLRPGAEYLAALDFSWSPDGQRIALRYASRDGARLAFFAAPDWQELTTEALPLPASQPAFVASANYAWAPDSNALAVELESAQGPFVTVFSIEGGRATPRLPEAITPALEAMAWFSPEVVFVVRADTSGREVVTFTLAPDGLTQFALPSTLLANPLELRPAPGGIVGGSADPGSFLYFWGSATVPDSVNVFTDDSYLSGGQQFVADPDPELGLTPLYAVGNVQQTLHNLADCSDVLAWADGPTSGSLAGARVACLGVQGTRATIVLHSFAGDGTASALALDEPALNVEFASIADWEAHARGFSPDGDWLALATSAHDFLVDLRGATPRFTVEEARAAGSTALAFSPSGEHLLAQRGRSMRWTVLEPSAGGAPLTIPLPDTVSDANPCSTARHLAAWCGAPTASRSAAARWHAAADVAVLPSSGGLSLTALTEQHDGLDDPPVSLCGAGCIRQYAFGP